MQVAQAQLAIRHLMQVEERVTMQREKIEQLLARGDSAAPEVAELGSLQRAMEVLKKRLADVIDPVIRKPSIEGGV